MSEFRLQVDLALDNHSPREGIGVARPMDAQAELGPCRKRVKVGSESPHLMPMQLGEPVVPAGRWVSTT